MDVTCQLELRNQHLRQQWELLQEDERLNKELIHVGQTFSANYPHVNIVLT
jgi:hypothetical protein